MPKAEEAAAAIAIAYKRLLKLQQIATKILHKQQRRKSSRDVTVSAYPNSLQSTTSHITEVEKLLGEVSELVAPLLILLYDTRGYAEPSDELAPGDILQMKFSQVPPAFNVIHARSHFGKNDDGFDGRCVDS